MKRDIDYKLYVVTEEGMSFDHLLPIIEQAVNGGASLIQLREKKSEGKAFYEKAVRLKQFLDSLSIPLIINDRVDIALAVDAAGVHLGQSDIPIEVVKKIIPDSMIVGISAHTVEEAVLAEEAGADYIGVGSVFPTSTKADAKLLPNGMLGKIIESVSIPVVAIGGINEKNASQLQAYKLDGIVVVSAITRADDPKSAAEKLLEKAFEYKTNDEVTGPV
ncbi:thiamine phosphate synthase [Bacillus norwichensis]|uniref:Thiamine-phosphate synthase n=1 Tax=Bacillus norwichensis TaxID=2762217 RepID=A0ABR8VS58_9BACI|nr:thiamine phosphate synthase [Bacillus norwichensis]MBD8007606.1 thiamine phosphate synthase [Bacillus norwichensis]